MRFPRITLPLACLVLFALPAVGQSPNGNINGLVLDPSSRVIVGAEIIAVNDVTGVQFTTKTNDEGVYVLPNLPPGPYRLQVSKVGFKTIIKPDIILNVQDALSINFTLPVGALLETVTVQGGAPLVNTESAAVSTVVDHQFVENMPLNGRSFQTLIMLTPGVVLTPANYSNQGQFSVNGQRSDSNYFTVDGTSANIGIAGGSGLGQSTGGALPGLSPLGGTNTLVSVDAMQEFRIQTSSFAPEFGSTPGGQVSIVTRSGTNDLHGDLFDYFRNTVLDANDWFANHAVPRLPRAPEHQNDFGGVIGGPIIRQKTFFFFSYEGLRLRQPQTQETVVPDAASRQTAPAAIQPFLNAFPVQNGPELGNNLAGFDASYSSASTLDAYSLRVDHVINQKLTLFGRYNYAPSQTVAPEGGNLSDVLVSPVSTQTFTLGLTGMASQNIGNELRANYSNYRAGSALRLTGFGGAVPIQDSELFPPGFSSQNGLFIFDVLGGVVFLQGKNATNEQRQVNLVDNLSIVIGTHQLKFGVDYRWLAPFSSPVAYDQLAFFFGMTGPGGVLSGVVPFDSISASQSNALLSREFSVYGQDTWKATRRLTITYGVRWDLNPPIKGKNSNSEPFTVVGLDDPANLSLAPRGTPLFGTSYGNIAPRLGAAYQLTQKQGWETVVRGGVGVFYDLGSGSLGNVTQGFPYTAATSLSNVPFPVPAQLAVPPPFSVNPPVTDSLYVTVADLKLPRTYQWNAAWEQSLGPNQSVSLTYVGAVGRKLLRQYFLNQPNADFSGVYVTTNTGVSNYSALQLKFQRRLSRGLQTLASYTFSHSIDNASDDSGLFTPPSQASSNIDRGNSDFDVRHSLTGALTYNIPSPAAPAYVPALLGNWSVDAFIFARSAAPVNIYGAASIVGGVESQARPDVVVGEPLYLYGPQYPGNKAFNATAFTAPPSGQQGDFGRNVLRGFGAWQTDFALHRRFKLTDRVGLQFRAEFFNIFNHPNFGDPTMANRFITSPDFGQSTNILASSLGSGGAGGGFNPLYQIGGPRSIQLALKLQF